VWRCAFQRRQSWQCDWISVCGEVERVVSEEKFPASALAATVSVPSSVIAQSRVTGKVVGLQKEQAIGALDA